MNIGVKFLLLLVVTLLVVICILLSTKTFRNKDCSSQKQSLSNYDDVKDYLDDEDDEDDENLVCFRTKDGISCINLSEEDYTLAGNYDCYNVNGKSTCIQTHDGKFGSLDDCRENCQDKMSSNNSIEKFSEGNFSCYNIQGRPTCVENPYGEFSSLPACRTFCGLGYYNYYPRNYGLQFHYPLRYYKPRRYMRRRGWKRGIGGGWGRISGSTISPRKRDRKLTRTTS